MALDRIEKLIERMTPTVVRPHPFFCDVFPEVDHARNLLPLMLAEIKAWRKFDRQWDDPDSRSDDLVDLEHAAYLLSMETDTYCAEHLPEQVPTEKARVR